MEIIYYNPLFSSMTHKCRKFHRSDGILLGGTFDRNDWSLEVNPEQSNRIINTHIDIMKGLK